MDWYAIQILTGKEEEVRDFLCDEGIDVLMPLRPLFLRHSNSISQIKKPLLPGYLIASLEVTDFYRFKRSKRTEKMIIRICGNGYNAIPLTKEEIEFIKLCDNGMYPLQLQIKNERMQVINPPPWAEQTDIEWYDADRFKAKLRIRTSGIMKEHSFTMAAFNVFYAGKYIEQLKSLSKYARQVRTLIT